MNPYATLRIDGQDVPVKLPWLFMPAVRDIRTPIFRSRGVCSFHVSGSGTDAATATNEGHRQALETERELVGRFKREERDRVAAIVKDMMKTTVGGREHAMLEHLLSRIGAAR